MPVKNESHPSDPSLYWTGTHWAKRGDMGSKKSGEQAASDLGFKGKTAKDVAAKDTGTMSLADRAARARAKTAEDQAKAVEEETKRKRKE